MMTDPISDMLTRIRNANKAGLVKLVTDGAPNLEGLPLIPI